MLHLHFWITKLFLHIVSANAASNYNKKLRKNISVADKIERQVVADHADIIFIHLSTELVCVEIRLVNHEPSGTKGLQEMKLKTQKWSKAVVLILYINTKLCITM